MSAVNIAGYAVSANPTAPNSLFACEGGGAPSPLVRFLENVTMTETEDGFVFKQTTGTGEEETIGTIQKIDNAKYIGSVEMSENDTDYIFKATTVSGDTEEIGRVKKEKGIDFIRPQTDGKLTKIEEKAAESYLDFEGTNGTALRLPLIYIGTFADPGNNLVQGLQTGTNHGANGEQNTYLLVRAESGLTYLYTLPDGGAIGQVLSKRSAASYDFQWSDAGNPVISLDENAVPAGGKFDRIAAYYGNDPVIRFITDTGDFISAGIVPPGGTAGQILRKKSADDYDTEWADNYDAIFDIEKTTLSNANVCVCEMSTSFGSTQQYDIVYTESGWSFDTANNVKTNASPDNPISITIQQRGIPRTGQQKQVITTDHIFISATGHSAAKRFVFDIKGFLVGLKPASSTSSYPVLNQADIHITAYIGSTSFVKIYGGIAVSSRFLIAYPEKTVELNDTDIFNLTVSNIRFYKVTEVSS